ncbi:rare lipoA family protein [Synechococcus sp. BIOS-E4-1]|uniref:septal ring lytic transglycosylase RlpA family protein n=1 Tax=Synechococcus sp. BIOS-E4-1 TaxID=1400864 RepID=UPI0016443A47|nr:septal ring lytic transglycosylase RlpA family protein [Synechococcus sp. BIOS-E4-1]QNI53143.1 rare lipoA family protein [Synechococcus sp. BIOS-E4-1]
MARFLPAIAAFASVSLTSMALYPVLARDLDGFEITDPLDLVLPSEPVSAVEIVEPSIEELVDPETTDPLTTDPLTADPLTTDPLTTDPLTTDPLTTDPLTTDPLTTDPLTTDPLTAVAEPEPAAIPTPPEPPNPVVPLVISTYSGEASWYGPGFYGNRTASGEVFRRGTMTAAHRTLPFGTRVRVTNLWNGRKAVVRINDRGPFAGDRVIDLAHGAASELGLTSSGIAQVRLEVLR